MKKYIVTALLLALSLVLVGCGEDAADEGYTTPEKLIEAFISAANDRDREAVEAMFINEQAVDQLWERIEEYDWTFADYTIEEGTSYHTVIFGDSANWESHGITHIQELYVAQWDAEGEHIDTWLFNGQGWHMADEEEEEVEENGEENGEETVKLEDVALEYLEAEYLDDIKAIAAKYDVTGDIQFYMSFKDGGFERLMSTASGYGDTTAYDNAELRAELEALLATMTLEFDDEVNVFWILQFPL